MELVEGWVEIDDLDSFVATLGEIGDRHGATVQAFDARYVADREHLARAVELADRAIKRGENVARDRAVEILLYAAGRRQIDDALEMGVDEGESRVVVLVDGGEASEARRSSSERSSDVGDEDGALDAIEAMDAFDGREPTLAGRDEGTLREFFEITDAEREATDADLAALVRERVALLDVEK